jgi:Tfp pilus assembly protein PilO
MNHRMTLYTVAAIAIAGAWYGLLYLPGEASRASIIAKSQEARTTLEDFRTTISDFERIVQSSENLDSIRQSLNLNLYSRGRIVAMFESLEQSARAHNLVTVEIAPSVEELLRVANLQYSAGVPQYLNFGFTVSGRFHDFGDFIQQIEESPLCQGITRCQIVSTPLPSEPSTFHVRLKALLGGEKEATG